MLKARIIAILTALLPAAAALADEINVPGFPLYANATILDVRNGSITFRTQYNPRIVKALKDVASIRVTGKDAFNQAELLAEPSPAEAVRLYDEAGKAADQAWMAKLVWYRRLRALDAAGMIYRATEQWLLVADDARGDKAVLELRPKNLPGGPSDDLAKAISLLESKLPGITVRGYKAAAAELLTQLRERQGVAVTSPPPSPDNGETPPSAGQAAPAGSLAEMEKRLASDPRGVADSIHGALATYGEAELPQALMLAGKAQLSLAQAAGNLEDRRTHLLGAGLDLMRVVVFCGESPQAPEALFLAAVVNVNLGNKPAAITAFKEVGRLYPQSDFAARASAAVEQLQ